MYHVQISTGCLSSHWGIKPATFAERYAVSIYSPDFYEIFMKVWPVLIDLVNEGPWAELQEAGSHLFFVLMSY